MRMEIIGCTRSVAALTLIFLSPIYFSSAQPGFLSIDCGGKGSRRDNETGITWIPDDGYIQEGRKEEHNDSDFQFYHQSLRVFPKPLRKSCYRLPITPNVPFLLRLSFVGFNYNNKIPDFNYSIETRDMLTLRKPTNQTKSPTMSEKILVSRGEVLYICLIRTSDYADPFISSIEVRSLRQGMYNPVQSGVMLNYRLRFHLGSNPSLVRYPMDQFDRIWYPLSINGTENLTSVVPIATNNTKDLPPTVIMQTAVAAPGKDRLDVKLIENINQTLLLLYFADIRNSSNSTPFDILTNNEKRIPNVQLNRNLSAMELSLITEKTISSFTVETPTNPTGGVLLNAFEWYQRIKTSPRTVSQDVQALKAVKARFNLRNWVSDPCFTIAWGGIQCNISNSNVRVSKINLSGRNLNGTIPSSLANMTALINISFASNQLRGTLPNLSKLDKLEILYLQNNNLSGNVPEWLSQLPKLKELFIQNNNFSGVIPQRLLDNPSLRLLRDGNPNLCRESLSCQRSPNGTSSSHSNRRKMIILAALLVSGTAIIGLILFLAVIVYRKKFRTKETVSSDIKGFSGDKESIHVRGQDFSMVLVPNSTKTRSFTLDEMLTATEEFSHKIGQGGFGSVFLGRLHEGKQIAVKVLSSFSKQGAVEFLNEIDLLSRVHHKNLVSLLGYCNESRELMLAYEYMPGGSLKDHLYGPSTGETAKLDWKTRLKIALDAAYGLEYLHVGCNPKIIHRDVKSANILLDANLNGKLADFGLSRVTIDGEASHVTTTVKGTAGYLDPEYFSTQMLTEKSDVYSFGVVLLEIICGRRPIDVKLSEDEVNLIRWVTPYLNVDGDSVQISKIVDKRLLPNEYDTKSVIHLAKLAIRCAVAEPLARPNVTQVVAAINVAIKYENEKNAREVDNVSEFSADYGDRTSSRVSMSDLSGPTEIASSENNSNIPR